MFERFTDRARRVVVIAHQEARGLGHVRIGTEHLLLGLLEEREGVAAQSLASLGITPDSARARITEIVPRDEDAPRGHLPFTSRAKKVLELSLREAIQLHHSGIGTEHILLGLVREGEGLAAQVLSELGAELAAVRDEVVRRGAAAPAAAAAGGEALEAHSGGHRAHARSVAATLLAGIVHEGSGPQLRGVVALGPDHTAELADGTRLTLISLELWSDAFELRYLLQRPAGEAAGTPLAPPDTWTLHDDQSRRYQLTGGTSTGGQRLTVGANRYAPALPPDAQHLVLADPGDGPRLEIPLR